MGDTGGDGGDVGRRKEALREWIWKLLEDEGASRFPGARGRIPNFTGAEAAADRLRDTEAWKRARALKANPDSPQWPVRQRALEDGKKVYMAVPKLADERPFFLLDPEELDETPRRASSIKGASRCARRVGVEEMEPLGLVVAGCVAAAPDGARLGKGGGYSDLEYALAREAGLLDEGTPVVTTVHELQVVPEGEIPMTGHDIPLDLVVTPERTIRAEERHPRPAGIRWGELEEEKIEAIPVLRRLRGQRQEETGN